MKLHASPLKHGSGRVSTAAVAVTENMSRHLGNTRQDGGIAEPDIRPVCTNNYRSAWRDTITSA